MLDKRVRSGQLNDLLTAKWLWSYIGAIVLYIAISFVSSDALGTLVASASFASFFMLVGMGQMLVITLGVGNIDLSIPYTIGLVGFVSMKVMNGTNSGILLGIVAGLLAAAAIGTLNFALIRLIRIPPLIATLASGFIVQTVAIVEFRGLQIKPPSDLSRVAVTRIGGVLPVLFLVVVVIAIVMHLVVTRSRYGRYIHAIGQNAKAASLAGINVNANKFLTYLLCSLFAGTTGILLSAFGGGVTLNMGHEYLLNSIAVPVIGGTSIAGGDGNIPGIIGASMLLLLILYLFNILGIAVGLRSMFTGIVILAIILASSARARAT